MSEEDDLGEPVIRGKGAGTEARHTWSRSSLCVRAQLYLQSLRGWGGGVEGVQQKADRDQKSQKISFPPCSGPCSPGSPRAGKMQKVTVHLYTRATHSGVAQVQHSVQQGKKQGLKGRASLGGHSEDQQKSFTESTWLLSVRLEVLLPTTLSSPLLNLITPPGLQALNPTM